MASPPTLDSARVKPPHLVSLVIQSKKALQHGEQLCSRANTLSNHSAQCSIDVLALDAKVKWITDAVLDQLRLAASVAKSLEEKRAHLARQVGDWDTLRVLRTDALENMLESLGSQVVPPGFHQSSSDSSLFGSQHSDHEPEPNGHVVSPQRSPTATLRNDPLAKKGGKSDRKTWKTLRDFVDDRAIEGVLETIDEERIALDDILAVTDTHADTLHSTTSAIQHSLPGPLTLPSIEDILASQDKLTANMAGHLESLTSHYDQMAGALRESEAGEAFSDEDLQDMNRDTNELPSIMAELEESVTSIGTTHDQLVSAKEAAQEHLDRFEHILDELEELGEIMSEMLQQQQNVEGDCEEQLSTLHQHLLSLEHLHQQFISYEISFSKLLLEIGRRRQYQEAAENIVKGMISQLEDMTEEERQVRDHFNTEHGAYLPEDLCLCVADHPTKWDVVPWNGSALEVLPEIDNDILEEAKERLNHAEGALGTESL